MWLKSRFFETRGFAPQLLSLAGAIALICWTLFPLEFRIVSPLIGTPHIGTVNTPLHIEVKTSLPWLYSNWRVSLSNVDTGKSQPLSVSNISRTLDGKQILAASMPSDLSPGRYDLVVERGDNIQTRPQSVYLWNEIPTDLKIIQLTDLPIFKTTDDSLQRMEGMIREINFINPDIVLLSGDLAKGGLVYQYETLMTSLQSIEAPTLVAPGNHAHDGWHDYLIRFGFPHYSLTLGDYQFITLNSKHGRDQFTKNQLNWFLGELAAAQDKTTIIQLHHPLFAFDSTNGKTYERHVRARVELFLTAVKAFSVPLVIGGHMQGDSVFDESGQRRSDTADFPGTKFVTTTAAGDTYREKFADCPTGWGYRLLRFEQGKLLNYTYDRDGDGNRDAACSIPAGSIVINTESDGATIVNNLNESFEEAVVDIPTTFKTNPVISNVGEIISRHLDDDHSYVRVKLNVPANSTQQLSLEGGQ